MAGLSAGELRHRVTIEQYVSGGRDDNGHPIDGAWILHKTLWAKITPLSARDLIAAQAAQSQVIARMKIRYRTDINTTMRVVFRGDIYAIDSQALADDDTGNIYCTFLLSKGLEKFQ